MVSRGKTWVVRPGDGETAGEIVRRAGEDESAFFEGRVFVGRRRATRASERVRPGDTIRVGARRPELEAKILAREPDLVAVEKPSGTPTVPDHRGASHSLSAAAARAVGASSDELRVTSRLDREVSGVVVFALGDAAEARLRGARERGAYARRYVALASAPVGAPGAEAGGGTWEAPIGRAKDPLLRAIDGEAAKAATTRWREVARAADGSIALLAVEPVTGRTHQIRVHASHARMPLLGDRRYGGAARIARADGCVVALARIALHAARVAVPRADGTMLSVTSPIPEELARVWTELGGEPAAWDTAVSCEIGAPGS